MPTLASQMGPAHHQAADAGTRVVDTDHSTRLPGPPCRAPQMPLTEESKLRDLQAPPGMSASHTASPLPSTSQALSSSLDTPGYFNLLGANIFF